jgi:hypothetical protein
MDTANRIPIELIEQALSELKKKPNGKPGFFTVNDISESIRDNGESISTKRLRDWLRTMIHAGRVEVSRDNRTSIDGRSMSVPVYKFKERKK